MKTDSQFAKAEKMSRPERNIWLICLDGLACHDNLLSCSICYSCRSVVLSSCRPQFAICTEMSVEMESSVMQRHIASCFTLWAFCLAIGNVAVAEDLASLREKISNNLATIASIEVRYQKVSTPLNHPDIPKHILLAYQNAKPRISVWAKQGVREFYELKHWPLPTNRGFIHRLWSFDGREYIEFHHSSEDVVTHVDVRNAPTHDSRHDLVVSMLIGLSVLETRLSLLDLLSRPTASYVGSEEVEGHLCHKIELGEYEGFNDTVRRLTLWVDPDFDYLPRKLAPYLLRTNGKPYAGSKLTAPYLVLDYFQVEDSALGRKRWLPKKVGYPKGIEILEARINPTFPADRFTLRIPDGAHVTYLDQRVPLPIPGSTQTRVRSEIAGGAAGAELAVKRSEENAIRQRDAQISTNQSAETVRQRWYLAKLAAVVLLIGLVTFVVWKRSRRWSQSNS